jgi:hypothetical protein
MDYRGQTAVLSVILVLVVMMFLVPAITEKALAIIKASAIGTCGPEGQTHPCNFALFAKHLYLGKWVFLPTDSGTRVSWETSGNTPLPPGDEKGWVQYQVGGEPVTLWFDNPANGNNKCEINPHYLGTCHAGFGYIAAFTYTLRVK